MESRQLVRADGTRIAVEVSASVVRLGGETTTLAIFRNVTERDHAQAALRASAAQYRLLFESNPRPMWVYDQATLAFLAVNEAALRHYGYTHDRFLDMTLRDIQPGGGHGPVRGATGELARGRTIACRSFRRGSGTIAKPTAS